MKMPAKLRLPIPESVKTRFLEQVGVRDENDCWLWRGGGSAAEGGRFYYEGRTYYTKVFAFFVEHGREPHGKLRQICDHKLCCNPAHIFEEQSPEWRRFSLSKSFNEKVLLPVSSDSCHVWIGALEQNNYGIMRVEGRSRKAHHVAWFLKTGEWPPKDLHVRHLCNNKHCVNFAHLELGTPADNRRDAVEACRTATGKWSGTHTHPESICRGSKSPNSKLNEEQVVQIRKTFHAFPGKRIQNALAKRFGVDSSIIAGIRSGKSWSHVDPSDFPDVRALALDEFGPLGHPKQEASPHAKVTQKDVREMRYLFDKCKGAYGIVQLLASTYGLGTSTVSRICHRMGSWASVSSDGFDLSYLDSWFQTDKAGKPIFSTKSLRNGIRMAEGIVNLRQRSAADLRMA